VFNKHSERYTKRTDETAARRNAARPMNRYNIYTYMCVCEVPMNCVCVSNDPKARDDFNGQKVQYDRGDERVVTSDDPMMTLCSM
jgi:hypothetical protein